MSSSSDYNTSGKSPSNVAGAILYSDLDLRMIPNGVGDIAPVTDIDAVKNAVRNLVLSNYHDRPHQPFLGSNIRALLFEPVDSFTASLLKLEIERVLVDHEPRVNAIAVTVTDLSLIHI